MDEDSIRAELDKCLYDDGSDNPDLDSWSEQSNPFPTVPVEPEEEPELSAEA